MNAKEVVECFRANPDYTSRMIAETLNYDAEVGGAYVRSTLKRNGLTLRGARDNLTLTLGRAARLAGMTVNDIEKWKNDKCINP